MITRIQIQHYIALMRLNKPIGTLLLLWPTLWALWLANRGQPDLDLLGIFVVGVFLMRTAGCIVNDIADRHFDRHVARTKDRPLASNKIKITHALLLALLLILCAFGLVLLCNSYTISLAFLGLLFAVVYPFLKRVTHLPQLGLGIAFAWGVPMAFAASNNILNARAWFLFSAAVIWPIIYDTIYAMMDRDDDIKIGVKSTAILFDSMETVLIGLLQCLFIMMMAIVGVMFHLHPVYFYSLGIVFILFFYQQYQIRTRDPEACMRAFLNNNLVGFAIFIGILASYMA